MSSPSNLPTGTVTFLFTDIEGSTRKWEQHPQAMKAALDRHDAILRGAIASSGGVVVQTAGDSYAAPFPTAPPALAAALSAQRELQAEPWPEEIGDLRVRMALHTGPADVRDGYYHAEVTLNRLARLLAAGYGGQVLLSLATQQLVRDSLPPGTDLLDLGEHWLKDVLRPERVFQLAAPD